MEACAVFIFAWGVVKIAKEFAASFYKTQAWQKNRAAFVANRRGLCEVCAKKGLIVPGVIVHHRQQLTQENINDPSITMAWENLQLLCRDCHGDAHAKGKRWKVDEMGRVTAR